MPFIDAKITKKLSDEKKEALKADFGALMTVIGKSEAYLMVGIDDSYDLWLGGRKLTDAAYVSVSLLGNAPSSSYEKMTACICNVLSEKYDIPGTNVYVTYHPVADWGWNGNNF